MTPEEYINKVKKDRWHAVSGGWLGTFVTEEDALAAIKLTREEMKAKEVAPIKCEKKSPITGGEMRLMQEKSSVKFRGEEVSFVKKFYHCVDSGQDFTDTELDNDNMWAIFRAYWERKGFEHFYDIDGYREEQEPASPCENCEGNELPGTCASISSLDRCPLEYNKEPISEDFESEWKRYCDSKGGGAVTMNVKDVAKHFAQWQKESDQKELQLAEEHGILTGMNMEREKLMKDAVDGEVNIWDSHISLPKVLPSEFSKQRVKVIIIKE